MTRFGFNRDDRIRRTQDFARIYNLGRRKGDRYLLIFAAANELGRTRIGLSVSRKHGSAVVRNRIKRLLREAFRLVRHDLPQGLDLVLIPRIQSGAGLDDYRHSLKRLAKRLGDS